MRTSCGDIVRELTDMIYEIENQIFKDYGGSKQADARYVNKKERINILKEIREHYKGLQNLEELLRESNLVCRDFEYNSCDSKECKCEYKDLHCDFRSKKGK